MPDLQSQIINLVSAGQTAVLRQENAIAAQVVDAYERARRDLLARFSDRFDSLPSQPAPEQIRQLANDISLIRAIDTRLAELETELTGIARNGLTTVSELAHNQAAQEILLLAEALGVSFMGFGLNPLLELTIGPALDQIPGLTAALRSQITASVREMLASGERFRDIINAIYAQDGSAFARGRSSAELMIRRAVIQAENNARLIYYEQAQAQIPGLKKQVIASISSDTTETCLRAHGQIQPLDKPFDISGKPSFGAKQMSPPFHWNCRSSAAPYHPIFERTSSLTTPAMQTASQAELNSR